jgi:hypothetical protein
VPSGGLAFELFLGVMGSDASAKTLWKFAEENKDLVGNQQTLSQADYEAVVRRDGGCFHGFILMGIKNMCRNSKRQLYFPTFVARFHGLSRQGVQIMSHFGTLMSITTYDAYEKQFLEEISRKNK